MRELFDEVESAPLSYERALERQREYTRAGRAGWFFFTSEPTITLGRRGHFSDVLMPMAELRRLGVRLLPVDRGGLVTFHGPGQILGFPTGTLEQHTGDSRGVRVFLDRLQRNLAAAVSELGHEAECRSGPEAGIWIREREEPGPRKVASIGMSFSRLGMGHGFALNVFPVTGFELVVPCGQIGARPACLFPREVSASRAEALTLVARTLWKTLA